MPLAHWINDRLGNVGQTVSYAAPAAAHPELQGNSLRALVDDLNAGTVDLLVVLGGNPVYHAPADLDFAAALDRAARRVHLGVRYDETARHCHWHLPRTHFLETWSDGRAFDGTVSIAQPLVEPLYADARSPHEVLDFLGQVTVRAPYDLVRAHWRGARAGEDDATFERWWRRAVHNGFVADSALPPRPVNLRADADFTRGQPAPVGPLELVLAPDPTVWDGRFANNPWLQETPKPLSKLTWDNAALVSPALAARLGLANENIVELTLAGRSVRAPRVDHPGAGRKLGGPVPRIWPGRRRPGR